MYCMSASQLPLSTSFNLLWTYRTLVALRLRVSSGEALTDQNTLRIGEDHIPTQCIHHVQVLELAPHTWFETRAHHDSQSECW